MTTEQAADPLNEQVIRRIRGEMAIQRVSQAALAITLGRTQTYISYLMTSKRPFTLPEVEAFASGLGLPIERLLFGESPAQRRRAS